MTSTEQAQLAKNRAAAEKRLAEAATFAELHICKPLFQKTMRRRGCPPVLVRLISPGILCVFDPKTGDLLAQSLPGKLRELDSTPKRGS
jgi:hypothetical protein